MPAAALMVAGGKVLNAALFHVQRFVHMSEADPLNFVGHHTLLAFCRPSGQWCRVRR
jgi:hypothetical protein